MAAPVMRLWKNRHLLQTNKYAVPLILNQRRAQASNAYFVVLPEIPPDTAETNVCMRYKSFPDFPNVTPGNLIAACAKLSIEYELSLDTHSENLADQSKPKDFASVFDPLEEVSVPLMYAHRLSKYLYFSHSNKSHQESFPRVNRQVSNAVNERWQTPTLYNSIKELSADRVQMTPYQQRVIDVLLLEAKHSGVELSDKNRSHLFELLRNLNSHQTEFRNKAMICRRMFSERLNFSQVKDMPKWLQRIMAEDQQYPFTGPWVISLQPHIYHQFMAYCGDRRSRWNVWQANNNIASNKFQAQHLGNQQAMENIQQTREDISKMLGYENYMEMSIQNKMAGSVENVVHFLDTLKSKLRPVAMDELHKLQDFADDRNFGHNLDIYDVAYWSKQQADVLFNINDDDLMQYFQLPKVLDSLFNICSQLFGITFKDCTGDVAVWDTDVRFYSIHDHDGTYLSSFYMDPYSRPNVKHERSWIEIGRDRSDLMGTTPISYLNANLQMPFLKGQDPSMTFANVVSLFREFGSLLIQQLTGVPYSFISGQRTMEMDALPIMSYLMARLAYHPHILARVSSHCESGQPLSSDYIQRIVNSRTHMSAYHLSRLVYLSAYDLECHTTLNHWHDMMTQLWEEYMPLPLNEDDNHPCSFTHIFSDQHAASLFSFLWAEMCAADIYSEFEEVGFEDRQKIQDLGKRLRDTYLSIGGGLSGTEVFRQFRGRDPSIDYFLRDHTKLQT